MPKLKILHIHTLPVISGSGIHTLITMKGLDKAKYEVEFACRPGGPLVDEVTKFGIPFRPIRHLLQPVEPYNDIAALFELIGLLKKQRYDIVHTHNSKAGFIGRLAAKIAGVPIIVHTIHGFSFHEYENPPRQFLFTILERIAAQFADALITVSGPLKAWGLKLGIGKEDKYITIYDGIEIGKFRVDFDTHIKRQEFGIKPDDLVIGAVSKLWEGKGLEYVLEALKMVSLKIPNVKLMFVGEGYLREKLEGLTEEWQLKEKVIFTGFRTDIPEITALFDIAVLASFFEGLGRVLLEAMAAGKPVVATRVGGIVDVVDDGKTGILVPPADSEALAEALLTLLSNAGLRRKMGEAGRKKIDAKFSDTHMVDQIEGLYEELTLKKGIK